MAADSSAGRQACTHAQYPHLFSPLRLRDVTLKNRVAMLPMGMRFAHQGVPTEGDFAFYRARARAGVGLIITGGTPVHENGITRARDLYEPFRREALPGLSRLADEIHAEGVPVFGQLYHRGRMNNGESDWPMMGPSAVPSLAAADPQIPHEMSIAEIGQMVEAFADSAMALKQCGFDGIEIHGAHGYLVAQFLARHANRREDIYGGTATNRMRFLLEIVAAVRARIGAGMPLGVRLSAEEGKDIVDGITLEESTQVARELARTGEVDYLSVTIGIRGAYVKDMSTPLGPAIPHASALRAASGLPVMVGQRINHPALAESALADGAADMIGMARALIADWAWAEKARDGRTLEIRPCIGCLQVCRSGVMGCVHSPTSGRETYWPARVVGRAPAPRRVVVVGGGPAGMEAAIQAAERGHKVVLLEANRRLGGQVRVAALAPCRADVDGVVAYRQLELSRLGVEVRTGVRADAAAVLAEQPDALVIATGAAPVDCRDDGVEVADGAFVIDVVCVQEPDPETERRLAAARNALVVDDGSGFWEACSAAERLAERGLAVQFATPARAMAANLPAESIGPLLRRLRGYDVQLLPMHRVSEIHAGKALLYDTTRLAATRVLEEREVPADVVVYYAGKRANAGLAQELCGRVAEIHLVGDCVSPRRINHAVVDGYRVGRSL